MGMRFPSTFRQRPELPAELPTIDVRDTAPVGRAVLWLAVLRQMGLRSIIDGLIRTESEISHGEVVEALVLNRLTTPRPLYRMEEWARGLGLSALTGREETRLNDDRIARTLDALASRIGDVQSALTTHRVAAFDVETSDVNYDTTSLYFEGFYEDSALAARGHSKDGKGDLKQVKLALVTSQDGDVPLTHITLAGNVADVTTVPAALVQLREHLEASPVVISGDATMWSRDNMDAVARSGGIFLGPISMIAAVQEWVCAADFTTTVSVQLTRAHKAVEYQACVAGRFSVDGVANAGSRIVVYDARRAEEQARDRRDSLEQYDAALRELQQKLNTTRYKTRAAVEKATQSLSKRHGLAARYVEVELAEQAGRWSISWTRDEAKLEAENVRDGRWPLVTNKQGLSDDELCAWAIRRDKLHSRIERDMHLVKGPLQIRPIFVHNDERIRALVAISVWALMALTLLERAGRKVLPAQTKHAAPVIARLEAMFASLAIMTIGHGDGVIQRAIAPLRRDAQSAAQAMGLSRAIHGILRDALARPAPD